MNITALPMNIITFPILIIALFVAVFIACMIHTDRKIRRLKAKGKPVPEERKIVTVIDWTRR